MPEPLDLAARVARTVETRDRFVGQPLDYFENDCGKMVIFHLRAMGWEIGAGGDWRSPLGLRKFLKRNGGSGAAVLDGWGLPRVTPARAIVGDVVEMPGVPPFGAFGVALGGGAVLAWSQHEVTSKTCAVLRIGDVIAAWRA